jgi:hypothetical protein
MIDIAKQAAEKCRLALELRKKSEEEHLLAQKQLVSDYALLFCSLLHVLRSTLFFLSFFLS